MKLGATMFLVFGLLAPIVAAVALHATLAFAVAQRRRELGIRSALGAQRADPIWLVMRQAGVFMLTGPFLGTLIAVAAVESPRSDVDHRAAKCAARRVCASGEAPWRLLGERYSSAWGPPR